MSVKQKWKQQLPVNMWSTYWPIDILTGQNGPFKLRVEPLRQEIKITLSYSTRTYLIKMSNDSYKLNTLLI